MFLLGLIGWYYKLNNPILYRILELNSLILTLHVPVQVCVRRISAPLKVEVQPNQIHNDCTSNYKVVEKKHNTYSPAGCRLSGMYPNSIQSKYFFCILHFCSFGVQRGKQRLFIGFWIKSNFRGLEDS